MDILEEAAEKMSRKLADLILAKTTAKVNEHFAKMSDEVADELTGKLVQTVIEKLSQKTSTVTGRIMQVISEQDIESVTTEGSDETKTDGAAIKKGPGSATSNAVASELKEETAVSELVKEGGSPVTENPVAPVSGHIKEEAVSTPVSGSMQECTEITADTHKSKTPQKTTSQCSSSPPDKENILHLFDGYLKNAVSKRAGSDGSTPVKDAAKSTPQTSTPQARALKNIVTQMVNYNERQAAQTSSMTKTAAKQPAKENKDDQADDWD